MLTTRRIKDALKTTGNAALSLTSRIPAAFNAYLQDSVRTMRNQPELVAIYTTSFITSFGGIGNFIGFANTPGSNRSFEFYMLNRTAASITAAQQWIEDYTLVPTFPNEYFIKAVILGAAVGIFAGVNCAKSRSKERDKKIPEITFNKARANETEFHLGISSCITIPFYFWILMLTGSKSSSMFEIFFLKSLLKHVASNPGCVINFPRSERSMIESYLKCPDVAVQDKLTRAANKFARQMTYGITVNPFTATAVLAASGFALVWKLESRRKKKEVQLEEAKEKYLDTYRKKIC